MPGQGTKSVESGTQELTKAAVGIDVLVCLDDVSFSYAARLRCISADVFVIFVLCHHQLWDQAHLSPFAICDASTTSKTLITTRCACLWREIMRTLLIIISSQDQRRA